LKPVPSAVLFLQDAKDLPTAVNGARSLTQDPHHIGGESATNHKKYGKCIGANKIRVSQAVMRGAKGDGLPGTRDDIQHLDCWNTSHECPRTRATLAGYLPDYGGSLAIASNRGLDRDSERAMGIVDSAAVDVPLRQLEASAEPQAGSNHENHKGQCAALCRESALRSWRASQILRSRRWRAKRHAMTGDDSIIFLGSGGPAAAKPRHPSRRYGAGIPDA